MIRDRSRPEPPADSGWKPLPTPGQSVQTPEDQTTPRQSAPPLPRPEYPILNARAPSIGSSTQFTTSTGPFRTAFNTSGASLPRAATLVGKRTQPVDSGIAPHTEPPVPTADTSIPPSSASLANAKIPSPPGPADSGRKPLPSPGHIVRVQAPEDQTTPRQSAPLLPRPEHPILNVSAPGIGGNLQVGGSTQFATSTESFSTPVNTSGASLLQVVTPVGKRTQPADNGIGPHLELPVPTADTSIPPSSAAPLANAKIPSPLPSLADSDRKPLPSQGHIVRVQAPEDQTTPKHSAPPLPRPEYPILNASAPRIGDSTQFATSTEPFRTPVNTSGASLPRAATPVGKRTQPVDSGIMIGLHMELPVPTVDISILPSSVPLANPKIPPLPWPGRELPSAPPVQKKEKRKNWFQKHIYDYAR
ncbi:hypothetical protein EDB89DRAFT_1364483 [Lactarius sanguifluus]|nr:hypothetical protein EDB89DRAFT_1364483 [Lactarius sanguifluus]